jgi:broad specificity phosphatase PhoE
MGVVYLIRHGQASFGRSNYDELSDTGYRQARVLGAAMRARVRGVDAVVTGTMRRHRQTAEACVAAMGIPFVARETPGFNELDHQEVIVRYEPRYADPLLMTTDLATSGDPLRAFQDLFERAVLRWIAGQHDAEYSESWPAFRARSLAALSDLVGTLGPSKTALVFTSGGPITAICQTLLQIPDAHAFRLSWTLANCAVTKVIYGQRGLHLSTVNEHAHFEGAHAELITYR